MANKQNRQRIYSLSNSLSPLKRTEINKISRLKPISAMRQWFEPLAVVWGNK